MRAALRVATAVLVVAGAVHAMLPATAQSPTPGLLRVSFSDNAYVPHLLEIPLGTTVSWAHGDRAVAPHSVTSQKQATESFDSNPNCSGNNPQACTLKGSSYSRTFTKAGSYPYYCRVHGKADVAPDPSRDQASQPCGMCGLITVRGATPTPSGSPTPTPRVPPSGVLRTLRPPVVILNPRRSSPSPSASPAQSSEPFASPPGPRAIPLSTPEAKRSSGGAGALAAVAAGIVVIALGASGVVAWRRRT